MELVKENIKINESVLNSSTQKMLENDVIVPDTKPDILKVLQVDAVSCIYEKNIMNGAVNIKGRVNLKVLYIPDSDTETVKSILTNFEFEEDISNKRIDPDDSAIITCNVERVEFNVVNSRKLKFKCVIGIDYEIIKIKSICIPIDCEEDIEIKRSTIKLQNSIGIQDFSFLMRERLSVPSGQSSFKELLKTDYHIKDTEIKCITGRIISKGIIQICLLYKDSNDNIEFCEGEFQFSEIWDMDDATEDTLCDIEYQIDEGLVRLEEDSDGDLREALFEVSVTAQVKAVENVEIDMINDCYAPYKNTLINTECMLIEEIIERPFVQNTIRDIVEISDRIPGVVSVYNVITNTEINSVNFENRRLICEGKIEVCILYISESSESIIFSIKKNIPFSYGLDCSTYADNLIPKIKAEVTHTAYNLSPSGNIELRCILNINANIISKHEIQLIEDIETNNNETNSDSKIVIYFVQNNDNLWDIAKHYKVPCSSICEFNDICDETLKPGTRLIIPGK